MRTVLVHNQWRRAIRLKAEWLDHAICAAT